MRIILACNRNGHRVICWRQVVLVFMIDCFVSILGAAVASRLLAGDFRYLPVAVVPLVLLTGFSIGSAVRTPVRQLPDC